jgi:hypothetical protein
MKKMTTLLAGMMLLMATAGTANALTLGVSTDGILWQSILDNGVGDTDTTTGSISYTNTTLSGFTKVKVSGASESTLQSGALYMNSFETSGSAAMLYLKLSDFEYNLALPTIGGAVATTGLTMQEGNATANLKTYYGSAIMDTTNQIADINLSTPGYIGTSTSLPFLVNPLSLTQFLTIKNLDGVASQVTASLDVAPVPEPGTLALVGLGMLGLAIYGKRRASNKEDVTPICAL